ncbi:MAG: TetR/AcrR family transcriptional regulator [Pseudomonadota bacterium]
MSKTTNEPSQPRQQRAIETYERLLRVTGELLGECGFEGITTNLIAERAGVTPPTLYRYFKDKYDVMTALSKRLMDVQDALLETIGESMASDPDFVFSRQVLQDLLMETVAVTENLVGGVWVMKCLRTVPKLNHIRTGSHEEMTEALTKAALVMNEGLLEENVRRHTQLSIELGYAAVEMVLDDPTLDRELILKETAMAIEAFNDAIHP